MTLAVFNKAMDKPSTEAAFSLKRTSDGARVNGSFIWFGNALIFTPSSSLRGEHPIHRSGRRDGQGPRRKDLCQPDHLALHQRARVGRRMIRLRRNA